MNKLKERILRTLKSLPGRVVYDPPPTKQKQKQKEKEKEKEKQKQQEEDDADDLFFFDVPPSPDSILNPKPHPDDDDDGGHHRTLDASYVLVHLPDASQPIAADAAQPNPNRNSNSNDGDDREEEEEEEEEEEKEEEEEEDLLREFEVRCPPGGEEAVIVYTTSLRGIRKTFEDCGRVRLLLRSLRAAFHERDVSMHSGYRDELWAVQGRGAAPPRVFVKGRYVGGAEELIALHEQGKLLPLLRRCGGGGGGGLCAGCGGATFVVCARCSGSCKVYDEERGVAIRCAICNENGLVACPLCL